MGRRRRRKRKQIRAMMILLAVLVLGITLGLYGLFVYKGYMKDYAGTQTGSGQDIVVEIPEGSSVKKIAAILHENGLITYEQAFVNRVKESEYRGKLKFGTYTLNTGMNTMQMIEVMGAAETGPTAAQTLTVPEGYSVEQIAARVAEQNICSEAEFLSAANEIRSGYDFLGSVPEGTDVNYKLQGFLFPATYNIYEDTTAQSLIDAMLTKFSEVYAPLVAQASESGYSDYEIITMASIVEREAKLDTERPTIAGVIFNRLKKNMPLQMCPTVLYPLTSGRYDKSEVTYADLEIVSPYNTYQNTGLPAGPICNPGESSIRAVLAPESHNYLYYHTDSSGDGSHVFSETYDEHVETQN